MPLRAIVVLSVLNLAAASTLGCGDSETGATSDGGGGAGTTGAGGSGGDGGQGGSGGDPPSVCGDLADGLGPVCTACVESSCCDAALACASATPCGQLIQCLSACDDAACTEGCAQNYPNAGADFNALTVCVDQTCEASCQAGIGICGESLTTHDASCDQCLSGSCCDEVDDCLSDDVCASCVLGRVKGAACANSAALGALFDTCATNNCGSECAN